MIKIALPLLSLSFFGISAQEKQTEQTDSKKFVVVQNIVRTTDDAAESQDKTKEDTNIYSLSQTKPEFPGGMTELNLFFFKNIQYTAEMTQKKLKGKIYSTFVVEKDGSIGDIKVIRGIGSGSEDEALRVLKIMPKWNAGLQGGIKVRCSQIVAVDFDANGK